MERSSLTRDFSGSRARFSNEPIFTDDPNNVVSQPKFSNVQDADGRLVALARFSDLRYHHDADHPSDQARFSDFQLHNENAGDRYSNRTAFCPVLVDDTPARPSYIRLSGAALDTATVSPSHHDSVVSDVAREISYESQALARSNLDAGRDGLTLHASGNRRGRTVQITDDMDRIRVHQPQGHQRPYQSVQAIQQHPTQGQDMPLAPVRASVPRYCFHNDMYWFLIECQMEDGRWYELSRYYADFYDFHLSLLESFPEEAGQKCEVRTLPFTPGPVPRITDGLFNKRQQKLDVYIKRIIDMPPHISKSLLVRNLFKPRPDQDFALAMSTESRPIPPKINPDSRI